MFLEEKEIEITADDKTKKFIISKFPAVAGREIITQYIATLLQKLEDYKKNEAVMFMLMRYVQAVDANGNKIELKTRELIDNHIPSWEMGMLLEKEVMEYNCSFFRSGKILALLKDFAPIIKQSLSKTLTDSSEQLSAKEKLLSEN